MKTKNLRDKILKEIRDFEQEKAKVNDSLSFNQKELIETADFYYMSKYKSGDTDSEGFKKYFYNIVRNPTNVFTKAIDFDLADIKFLTASGGNSKKTWLYQRDFKNWAKRKGFSKILNRIGRQLSKYGSAVIKTINGKPFMVDLKNFIIEQDAESVKDAEYIIEKHPYSPYQFQEKSKEKGWDNREAVIEAHKDSPQNHIMVYERYGTVEENGEYTYKRILLAEPGAKKNDDGEVEENPILLLDETEFEQDELPYHEFHLEKIKGRWLGIGVPEILEDIQMRMNELINLQVKASYWASLNIFQSLGDEITSNLLSQTTNGDVVSVDNMIHPIATEERNLTAYNQEQERWLQNRDEQTFSYEVMKGERLPAGTPLGSAQLAAGMATAYFDLIREDLANRVKDYIVEVVIPYFEKEHAKKEHTLRIAGEDLDVLMDTIKSIKVQDELFNFVERENKLPSPQQYELIKGTVNETITRGKEKIVRVPKEMYDGIQYDLDIIITGEQQDTRVEAQNLQTALQILSSNPRVLKDPVLKKVFRRLMEQGGINMEDIIPNDEGGGISQQVQDIMAQAPETQQGGGGVSRPQMPQTPVSGQQETRI